MIFGGSIVDGARFGFGSGHLPAAAVVIEYQIHHAKMVAPHAGHYRRHAVERSFVDICPFDAGKILTREDRMSVAEEDRVHARHFAQVVNRVFRHHLIRIGREARVGDNDHNIRPFFTHLRYVFTRRFGDVVNGNFAGEIGFIEVMIWGGTKPM